MARVFIESFETQKMDLWSATSDATIISSSGLDMKGNYCCSTGPSGYFEKIFPTNLTNLWVSFLWRKGGYSWYMFTLYGKNGAEQVIVYIYYSGSSKIRYLVGGYAVNGSKTISDNVTYFVQVHLYISGGRAYIVAYIDGVHDKTHSNNISQTSFTKIRFRNDSYFDNIVIDDSVMPERTEIIVLRPDGVGNYSDFVPTPSGNNYTCVDEIPYNDSDYVASGIVNAVDTYTLEDVPNAKLIKCVQMQARARKDSDSPLTKFNFVICDGSTNYYGDDILLSNTFSNYSEMWLDGPTGSGFWHPSDINDLEIGVRTRT